MIPLKNLDNKSFIELLQEARQNIHRFTKEWTDENYHDPGITLLELSSWLTEMQRYYLNRVTDRNYDSLFKLMGIKRKKNGYAQTVLRLNHCKQDLVIPKGMKFVADEQIFETVEAGYYTYNQVVGVFIHNDKTTEVTHLNNQDGICYKLFGDQIKESNSCSILMLHPFQVDKTIQMYIEINENYPVGMNDEFPLLKAYDYRIYQDADKTIEVEIIEDETQGFRKSGILTFKLNQEHVKTKMNNTDGYVICIQVLEDSWVTPPEINTLFVNALKVLNKNTVCDYEMYQDQSFQVLSELMYSKWLMQGSYDQIHWEDMDETQFVIDWQNIRPLVKVHAEYGFYRVVCLDEKQFSQFDIGSGSGISNHRIRFRGEKVVFKEMRLQIAEKKNNKYVWTDWEYVNDLIKASPNDSVFTYDYEEEELVFGNHEYGIVPSHLQANVRLLKLVKTDYDRGNVKRGLVNKTYMNMYPETLELYNVKDATKGSKPQETLDMHENAYRSFGDISRAVTLDQYEGLIKALPGYRISYCRALNNHLTENQISLVIVPYNGEMFPRLNDLMKQEILNYLESFRLITTRLDILDPVYVELNLYTTIKVKNRNRFNKEELVNKFRNMLTPIQGYVVNKEYQIGQVPTKADLIEELLKDVDVLNVNQITMEGLGLGVRKNKDGEVIIPKNGVIFANEIKILITD